MMFENYVDIHTIQEIRARSLVYFGCGAIQKMNDIAAELKKRGILPTRVRGYRDEEYTHMNVAAAVLSGRADCALGVRAAAVALGLDFVPVGVEQYDLVIPKVYADDERMLALLDVIRSAEFRDTVTAMGGYNVSRSGTLLWEYDGE